MVTNPYVSRRCQEIEELLAFAKSWSDKDVKLGAHLAAYICVLFLGVLEDCVENLIEERAKRAGDTEVGNYVVKMIGDHFRNPDFGAICGLLGEFSRDYKDEFSAKIKPNGTEAEALQALVDNKNSLAHEGVCKLTLSVKDMDDYYRRVIPMLQVLEQILA